MPIYEYDCPRCGRFDTLQKMSSPALEIHDVCGSRVTKLMSASAFAFKGSGFYANDHGAKRGEDRNHARTEETQSKPACGEGGCGGCRAASA